MMTEADYTPETLRACFAEEMGVVLPPGSMMPETAAYVAGKFADAWQEQVRELEAREKAWREAVLWVREHYPEDVFPPESSTPDAKAARMGRLTCDNIVRSYEAHMAASEPPGEEQG